MKDIVERLRDGGHGFVDDRELEAAAEIDRLRGLIRDLMGAIDQWRDDAEYGQSESERIRMVEYTSDVMTRANEAIFVAPDLENHHE